MHQEEPPQLASTRLLRGSATQSQDRALEARKTRSQSEAVDPAETQWQGPRTAASASLHRAAAGQGESSQDRAQEAREHTLAEQWIPRRRIGKGIGQPPQLASTRLLQGRATRAQRQSTGGAGTHARRAGCGSRGDALARAQDSRRS